MKGTTGVILNWKRPNNVNQIIRGWLQSDVVDEIIVWNNNPDTQLPATPGVKVINAAQDLGLYTRFTASTLASNECVLIHDDDLQLPADSLRHLRAAWEADPELLHGVFGRAPRADGSYAKHIAGDAEVPVVLTRALLTHRGYINRFFEAAAEFHEIQKHSRPVGNGEDILLSYVVRKASGRLNRTHAVHVQELPAHDAISSGNRAHMEHRTRLMRACEAWIR